MIHALRLCLDSTGVWEPAAHHGVCECTDVRSLQGHGAGEIHGQEQIRGGGELLWECMPLSAPLDLCNSQCLIQSQFGYSSLCASCPTFHTLL